MPSSRWESIIQSVEVLNRTKRRRKDEFTFCWAEISSSFCTQTVTLLIFGHLHSDLDLHCWFSSFPSSQVFTLRLLYLYLSWFSTLGTAGHETSVFKTMWTKSYKSFTIYTLLICFSGELWDNHVLLVFFLFLLMQCIDVSFLL